MRRERTPNLFGLSLTAALLLAVLMLASTTVLAQQQALDWARYNAVPGNWNWSPQKQLNKENVKFLEIKWAFAIPAGPPSGLFTQQGSMHTPIVYKGVVYFVTNWNRVYALDARNGKVLWMKDLVPPKDWDVKYREKYFDVTTLGGHYHQIHIYEIDGKPYLVIVPQWWHLIILDPFTGDVLLNYPLLNPDFVEKYVQGNRGLYDLSTPSYVIDTKRKIFIIGAGVSEAESAGRGFFVGIDLRPWFEKKDNPTLKWLTYIMPPQDGSDPEWAIKSVNSLKHAWIFDGKQQIDMKAWPDDLKRKILYDDWGFARFVQKYLNEKVSYAGLGAGWGGAYALDEDRGLVYVGTAQPAPDWNATFRPGPNLWSDSILALNVETGEMVWAFQTMAHDIWDYDCAWSVQFVKNAMVGGQKRDVVIKGCKHGTVFALDPDTGKALWIFTAWDPARNGGNPRFGIKFSKYVKFLDPTNERDMTWNWQGEWTTGDEYLYLKNHGRFLQNPPAVGSLEMDIAYDPERNRLYVGVYNLPFVHSVVNVGPNSGLPWLTNNGRGVREVRNDLANATVYAIDVNTGRVVWEVFFDKIFLRGGISTSNGLVFVARPDGIISVLDADDGKILKELIVGTPFSTAPSIAADADGRVKLFLTPHATGVGWGITAVPGFVVALGLPEVIAEKTVVQERTVVQTQVQTQVQTVVQTAVATQVVTQVQTQVREVEVIPAWVYAVTGVAVVAVIAAATIAVRGRRR
jgi:outer membrane protein assembly factor BamB